MQFGKRVSMILGGILLVLVAIFFASPLVVGGNSVTLTDTLRLIIGVLGVVLFLVGVFIKENKKVNEDKFRQAISEGNSGALLQVTGNKNTFENTNLFNIGRAEKPAEIHVVSPPQFAIRETTGRGPMFEEHLATFLMLLFSSENKLDAEDISAIVRISGTRGISEFTLIWENVEETARGRHGQLIDQIRKTDIRVTLPANGLPARVIVAFRYLNENIAYGLRLESTGIDAWKDPALALPIGEYQLGLEIKGRNIEPNPTVYQFVLRVLPNPGTFELINV
jgi:hypothetical protein